MNYSTHKYTQIITRAGAIDPEFTKGANAICFLNVGTQIANLNNGICIEPKGSISFNHVDAMGKDITEWKVSFVSIGGDISLLHGINEDIPALTVIVEKVTFEK